MQLVQTRMRLLPPLTWALTGWRFTFQRRRVVLWACEMLLPNCGPLPQRSHFCAITKYSNLESQKLPDIKPERMNVSNGAVEVVGTRRLELLTSTVSR